MRRLGEVAVAYLVAFACALFVGLSIWHATLPADSPVTEISYVSKSRRVSSGASQTLISVDGHGYSCGGASGEPVGTKVAYSASNPTRCRAVKHLGMLKPTEFGMIGVLFIALLLGTARIFVGEDHSKISAF